MSIPIEIGVMYDTSAVDGENEKSSPLTGNETDAELVQRTKSADYGAFEELVRRYRNDVFALAFHLLRDRESAWDVSQEVFIKAYRSVGRFRGDASFKTWLLRITSNHCKDIFKKKRLHTVAFDEVVEATQQGSVLEQPGRSLEVSELGQAIQTALDTLSEKHRKVFVLREYEGLSYEEMAEVLRCSTGTIMSRLHHARKKLQAALISLGAVEG